MQIYRFNKIIIANTALGFLLMMNQQAVAADNIILGSFTAKPSLSISSTWTDNAVLSDNKTSSVGISANAALGISSNWSRHLLDANLNYGYNSYFSDDVKNTDAYSAVLSGRFDILGIQGEPDSTNIGLGVGYSSSPDQVSDANGSLQKRSDRSALNANAKFNHVFGNLSSVSINIGYADIGFSKQVSADGTETSNSDRDRNRLGVSGSYSYTFSPGYSALGTVRYSNVGYKEAASRDREVSVLVYSGGLNFEIPNSNFSANVQAGLQNTNSASAFDDASSIWLNGSLNWEPSKLSSVVASLGTSFEQSNIDGFNGFTNRSLSLSGEYSFTPELSGSLSFNGGFRIYNPSSGSSSKREDFTYNTRLSAGYVFNDYLKVIAGLGIFGLSSDNSSANYDGISASIGVSGSY